MMDAPAIPPLPDTMVATRHSLHQLAFFALAPARYRATRRMGLRPLPGGFGTPPWETAEGRRRVRVEGERLVLESGDEVRALTPRTLREAVELLGIDYVEDWFGEFRDPLTPIGPDAPLSIDPGATAAHAGWFAFTQVALEALADTPGAVDVSEIQLWPEHFDVALEIGRDGERASCGGSPGDDEHEEPYLYVSAWGEIDRSDPYWNDSAFNGASLPHAELAASTNPLGLALDFFRRGAATLRR